MYMLPPIKIYIMYVHAALHKDLHYVLAALHKDLHNVLAALHKGLHYVCAALHKGLPAHINFEMIQLSLSENVLNKIAYRCRR